MKRRSDSLVGGEESGEPSKKRRAEEPSASSSGAGECSSPRAPPQQVPPLGGKEEQARVPDLGEDLVFEVLMRAEPRTLASAACVNRAWGQLARDERLWEAACVRDWASLVNSEQTLRWFITSMVSFRRLHELHHQRRGAGVQRRRMNRGQVQFSLSLLSTSFFQNMPNALADPKKKDKDNDKNGGGRCG